MADNVQQDQQRNWLVKSSTRILGPFSFDELVEQLRTKGVTIIDEVRQPAGRWTYIRENAQFLEVVKSIRDEQDSHSELTMTQSIAQHTAVTRTDINTIPDDLTPTPIPVHRKEVPANTESGIRDVTSTRDVPVVTSHRRVGADRVYGSADDQRVREKIQRKSRSLTYLFLAAAAAVVVVVALSLSQRDKPKSAGYDELMASALRYKSLGLYEKSLAAYKAAIQVKEPDNESQIKMAPLLISEDRQSLLGRRILEATLIQEGRGRTEIVESYLGIAVSYMMDGDLKQAEDVLQKAIGYEPFNISALLNMAIIQFKKGNYGAAMRDFDAIHRKSPQSVLALFGRSVAAIEYAQEKNDTFVLNPIIRDLKNNIGRTGYLRQELILLLTYAQSLLGDVDGVNQSVVSFLSQLPGQISNYVHPLDVDWRFSQWDYLEKYCSQLYSKQIPHAELKAVRSICLSEIKRDSEAQKLLNEALAEAPKDPYVLISQAAALVKVGRLPEAQLILKQPELQTLIAKGLLFGKICIQLSDVACAQRYFGEAYKQDGKNALALYGLAWTVLKNNERPLAYDYIRAGLQQEPNFLPLLELRDQLESE